MKTDGPCGRQADGQSPRAEDLQRVIEQWRDPACIDYTFTRGEAADELSAILASSSSPTCIWSLDDVDEDGPWETQCGHAFEWTTDGPKENQAAFCCYCGGKLIESRTSDAAPETREEQEP